MADIQPSEEQKKSVAAAAASNASDAAQSAVEPTSKEAEAKKLMDEAKAEEEKLDHIQELIKTKKYFLPIKKH